MTSRFALLAAGLAFGVTTAAGCGGTGTNPPQPMNRLIQDFKDMLTSYQKQNNKAPAAMADLTAEVELGFPGALWLLRNNKVVYIWGAPLTTGGQAVVAYETETPQSGGEVLLEDGTIKAMTAAEFNAAPKAAGKKT